MALHSFPGEHAVGTIRNENSCGNIRRGEPKKRAVCAARCIPHHAAQERWFHGGAIFNCQPPLTGG